MKNNSLTEAGLSKPRAVHDKTSQIDALNQVFTLFRLNYHNQYLKAFSKNEELIQVKRLWLEMLASFDAQTLLTASKSVIETSEFLPTLRTMIRHCERCTYGGAIPDAHTAYLEACRAPSPKAIYPWSHPAIYYAGKRCDWYFLQSTAETVAYPIFKRKYEEICIEIRNGCDLPNPTTPVLEQKPKVKLDKKSNLKRLSALRKSLKF